MKVLKKICDGCYAVTGVVNIIFLICIILFTFLQVISRYIISFSIPWAQELCIYSLVWMVLLGCSMGMRRHEVASLNLLLNKLPFKAREGLKIFNNLILCIFLGYIISSNITVINNAMRRLSGMMHLKMGYVNLALSVSSALIILYCIEDILNSIIGISKGKEKMI